MIAELVLSYYLASNMSSHLNVDRPPFIDTEIRLNVEHDFTAKWNLKLSPYVMGADRTAQIAGAEFELNYRIRENVVFGFYHHSSHTLDRNGRELEVDAIRLRLRLK